MFTYNQISGELLHDGEFVGTGYSGTGEGRNSDLMQDVPNIGPIPQGLYQIGAPYNDPHLGPCVMHLDPAPGTNVFGRTAFRIHGNNAANDASHGCIVLGPTIRDFIAKSGDTALTVLSGA